MRRAGPGHLDGSRELFQPAPEAIALGSLWMIRHHPRRALSGAPELFVEQKARGQRAFGVFCGEVSDLMSEG